MIIDKLVHVGTEADLSGWRYTMKYYLLGKSGLRVSELALGAMRAILANPTIKQTISGGVEVHRRSPAAGQPINH
jgi:hypothetical protein